MLRHPLKLLRLSSVAAVQWLVSFGQPFAARAQEECPEGPSLRVAFHGDAAALRPEVLRLLAVEVSRFGASVCEHRTSLVTPEPGTVLLDVSYTQSGAYLILLAHAGRIEREVRFSNAAEDARALLLTVTAAEALSPNWFAVPTPHEPDNRSVEAPASKARFDSGFAVLHVRGMFESDTAGTNRFGAGPELGYWPVRYFGASIEAGLLQFSDRELPLGIATTSAGYFGARASFAILEQSQVNLVLFIGGQWLFLKTTAQSTDPQVLERDFARSAARGLGGAELLLPVAPGLRVSVSGFLGIHSREFRVADGTTSISLLDGPFFAGTAGVAWYP
jgi:hypothetical protein